MSSLLSVLKIAILMLVSECPSTSLPENENTVNLKSAYFIVIMLLHNGLTHIHSQKKPRLHFGESFALTLNIKKIRITARSKLLVCFSFHC